MLTGEARPGPRASPRVTSAAGGAEPSRLGGGCQGNWRSPSATRGPALGMLAQAHTNQRPRGRAGQVSGATRADRPPVTLRGTARPGCREPRVPRGARRRGAGFCSEAVRFRPRSGLSGRCCNGGAGAWGPGELSARSSRFPAPGGSLQGDLRSSAAPCSSGLPAEEPAPWPPFLGPPRGLQTHTCACSPTRVPAGGGPSCPVQLRRHRETTGPVLRIRVPVSPSLSH